MQEHHNNKRVRRWKTAGMNAITFLAHVENVLNVFESLDAQTLMKYLRRCTSIL
jgi:hypothetical protein